MVKRCFSVALLLVLLAASFAGCRGETPQPASPASKSSQPPTAVPAAKAATDTKPSAEVKASPQTKPAAAAKPAANRPLDQQLVVLTTSFTTEAALPNLGSLSDMSLWINTYDYLISIDDVLAGRFTKPNVAERWEVSPDQKKYTFYLRKGIQFHDGWGELTSQDVKFSVDVVRSEKSISQYAKLWKDNITSMTVDDPYKITFTLAKPDWQFVQNLAMLRPNLPILSKRYVEKVGEKEANLKPIGSGHYKLVDRRTGDFLKFEAVPNHWKRTPEFKTVIVKAVPEAATRIAMLKSGEADIVPISADKGPEVKAAGYRTVFDPGALDYWVVLGSLPLASSPEFTSKNPWWADPSDTRAWDRALKVRKALNLAINRQEIIDKLFVGNAAVGVAPYFSQQHPGFNPAWKPYPFDPQQAKQLLNEAGYPNGFELTQVLLKHSGRPEAPQLGEAVAMYWENIGLKVKRVPMDFDTLRPLMESRKLKEFWVYGKPWEPSPLLSISRQSVSFFPYASGGEHPTLEALAKRSATEMDPQKRLDLEREMGQFLYDNYITVPLLETGKLFAVGKRVGDWPVIEGMNYDAQNLAYITYKP